MSAKKWDLPDRYEANGYHYKKVEQLKYRWGVYSQACRPDGKIVGYELVRPSPNGSFPPPDDNWGTDGFTFTWESHLKPLESAYARYSEIYASTGYKAGVRQIGQSTAKPIPNPQNAVHTGKRAKNPPRILAAEEWARVAPQAKWRKCRKHGETQKPLLGEKVCSNRSKHLVALCPACQRHLAFLPKRKPDNDASPAEMERHYRRFLAEALAGGNRSGQAYYRYKAKFGKEPDPAWRGTDHA